jgi:uncharacterized membrane protein (DUF4010 family)
MELEDLLSRLALALGIGLLIGLERGWTTRDADPGTRTAGIRTFAITGLLGGMVGALAQAMGGAGSVGGGLLLGLAFAAHAGVFAAFCREENRSCNTFSATTAVVGMTTFVLGAYAVVGELRLAAAAAVAIAALLALRKELHGWVRRITWPELRSGLVLLAMTFIALPVVPDDPIGPYGGVNPREVWIIAILLAAVSFLGYAGVKYLGARHGVLVAAAAGGLVSSTAVTAANARRAAAKEGSPVLLAAGVSLATAISVLRVCGIVAALKPSLLVLLGPPLAAAAAVAGAHAVVSAYWRASPREAKKAIQFRNPFGFWSVVGFSLLLGVVIVVGRVVGESLGATGAVLGAAAMGLVGVDAITVSMARLVPQPLSPEAATYAILAAVGSNTISKLAIGAVVGRGRFGIELAVMSVAAVAAAGAALWGALLVFPGG